MPSMRVELAGLFHSGSQFVKPGCQTSRSWVPHQSEPRRDVVSGLRLFLPGQTLATGQAELQAERLRKVFYGWSRLAVGGL